MSEQVPASEPTTGSEAAPAQSAPNTAAVPATQVDAPAFPTFGSSRGSGLARGKRTGGSSQAKQAPAPNYQPSTIQVVNPVREYVNPFGGATSVPSAEAPVAPVETPVAAPAPAPVIPVVEAQPEIKASAPAEADVKAELNILPPEPVQTPAQSWENTPEGAAPAPAAEAPRSFERRPRREDRRGDRRDDRRDDRSQERREDRPADASASGERPIFRPERRDRENQAPRPEGNFRREDRRPVAPAPAPVAEEPKKSTGLLGWLKGLFSGGAAKTEETPAQPQRREDRPRDGQGRHGGRHHGRGGRDRQFRSPNPQAGSQEGGSEGAQDGRREGGFRRRRRGGRGRGFRPDGRGEGEASS